MLSALMIAATLTGTPPGVTPPDILAVAIAHFQTIKSYRVTIHSLHDDDEEHLRYYYKKPGFVRMEFSRPHSGAVLVYNPDTQRVRLWPFGAGRFPELNLSPGNLLIRSSRGQQVDRSDVGALLENVRSLQQNGTNEVSGAEMIGDRTVMHLIVTGATGTEIAGVHRYELWLDTSNWFPAKVISRDLRDVIIETVKMDELEVDVELPETLFNP